MPESQIVFQVRMTLPGEDPSNASITGKQMTATIDKAHARGRYAGWCDAMHEVRNGLDEAGIAVPEEVFCAVARKAPKVP